MIAIKKWLLISMMTIIGQAYAQTTETISKLESSIIKTGGIHVENLVQDIESNFFILTSGTKKLKTRHQLETFDKNLKHLQSTELDLPKGEFVRAIESCGNKVLIVSSQDLDMLNSGTIGYGVPDKNVYVQNVNSNGKMDNRISISLFDEKKQSGESLQIVFSEDKSKLLFFTNAKYSKRKPPNVTCWVYETGKMELLWKKNLACSRTEFFPENVAVTNSGNVLVRYEGNNVYLIKESETRAKKLRVSGGSGKVLAHTIFKELPSGKLIIAGGIGPDKWDTQGWLVATIDEENGTITESFKKQFPDSVFDFYGIKIKKLAKGKGIYQFNSVHIVEDEAGDFLLSFERDHVERTGSNAGKRFFHSPLIVKVAAAGQLEDWWTIPALYLDGDKKGGGHVLFIQKDKPMILMNNNEDNLANPKIIRSSQAEGIMHPEHNGSISRNNTMCSYLIELNDNHEKTFKKIYDLQKDQLYMTTTAILMSSNEIFGVGGFDKNLKLMHLKI